MSSPAKALHYKETQYGFEYGSAIINRISSDEEKGWVVVEIASKKSRVQVYVTKTGKIRVYSGDGEWLCQKKQTSATSAAGKSTRRPAASKSCSQESEIETFSQQQVLTLLQACVFT